MMHPGTEREEVESRPLCFNAVVVVAMKLWLLLLFFMSEATLLQRGRGCRFGYGLCFWVEDALGRVFSAANACRCFLGDFILETTMSRTCSNSHVSSEIAS